MQKLKYLLYVNIVHHGLSNFIFGAVKSDDKIQKHQKNNFQVDLKFIYNKPDILDSLP